MNCKQNIIIVDLYKHIVKKWQSNAVQLKQWKLEKYSIKISFIHSAALYNYCKV